MERIKQQVDQLQQQLAGLSASQKMLTATLVAIMIATVIWWTRYAAMGEMVAVVDQALTADEMAPMSGVLDQRGIEYVIDGDRLLVSASDRARALSQISAGRALPRDTTNHFSKAVKGIGAFDSSSKVNMIARGALQDELTDIIRGWDHVASANVLLTTQYKQQIRGDIMPRASIEIQTNGRIDRSEMADAAAYLAVGAVSMLEMENITVTIDQTRVKIDREDGLLNGGSDFLVLSRNGSEHYANEVRQVLGYIPGLHVGVGVKVNDKALRRLDYKVDPETAVSVHNRESTKNEDSRNGGGGREPGLIAMGPASSGSAEATQSENLETRDQESSTDYGKTRDEILQDAGATTPITCSVSIPISHVISEWMRRNDSETKPEPAVLQAYEEQVLDDLKTLVSMALGGIDTSQIACRTYFDGSLASAGNPGAAGAAGGLDEENSAISGLLRNYGKEAAVAALAMVSLFLVSTMVKKSAPLALPGGPSFESESLAMGGDEMAGIVGGTGGLMVAQEVSEDAVQSGQVLEQVQTLVKENPDAAAALVNRWLNVS